MKRMFCDVAPGAMFFFKFDAPRHVDQACFWKQCANRTSGRGPADPINVSQTLSGRASNCHSESGRVLVVFLPFVRGLFRKEILHWAILNSKPAFYFALTRLHVWKVLNSKETSK